MPAARSLRPRKAPRQTRSEQTVATLLEAAAQVLERDGLSRFTTNAVAERAGVGVGSLYQYFSNKDALVLALMRREDEVFHAAAEPGLRAATGAEALGVIIQAAAEQQLLRPELARLLDLQQAAPALRGEVGGPGYLLGLIQTVLERLDLPRQPCPVVATRDVLAIVRGLTDTAGENGERDVSNLGVRVSAAVFGYLNMMADRRS